MATSAEESTLIGVLEQVLHTHFTEALQGLLPATIDWQAVQHVLDVSCRMGAWPIDVALSYPGMTVTGVENDARFVERARRNIEIGDMHSVRFYEASPLEPLPFAPHTFDLVHMLQVIPQFRPTEWPLFLGECRRVLKPNGTIHLVSLSLGPSSSTAYQRVLFLIDTLMLILGYSFSSYPGRATPGVHLCRLLHTAGFTNVTYSIHPVNFGGKHNISGRAVCQLLVKNVQLLKPLFVQHHLIDDKDFDQLMARKRQDIDEATFCATGALFSVVATNPTRT